MWNVFQKLKDMEKSLINYSDTGVITDPIIMSTQTQHFARAIVVPLTLLRLFCICEVQRAAQMF